MRSSTTVSVSSFSGVAAFVLTVGEQSAASALVKETHLLHQQVYLGVSMQW